MLEFLGYLSISAAQASQRVVLLGFSTSSIESSLNHQSYQRCWCVPAIIALFVPATSSMDRASLLGCPVLYHIEPCEVLHLASGLYFVVKHS